MTTADSIQVLSRALDQAGNLLPFLDEPVTVEVTGAAKLLGPQTIILTGGTTGFWIESTGTKGTVSVKVSSPRFATQTLSLTAV